jgi:hypothetical protein
MEKLQMLWTLMTTLPSDLQSTGTLVGIWGALGGAVVGIVKTVEWLVRKFLKRRKGRKKADGVLGMEEETPPSKKTVTQSSRGNNSPNVAGDNNTVLSVSVVLPQSFPITEHCLDDFLMSHTQGDWEDETCVSNDGDTARKYRYWSRKDRRVSYIISSDENNRGFYSEWLNFIIRPDPSARIEQVEFFFEQTSVFKKQVVSLDGGRFVVPLPKVVYHDGILEGKFSGEKKRVGLGGNVFEMVYPLDHHPVKKVIWTKLDMKIASFLGVYPVREYLDSLQRRGILEVI